MSDIDKSKQGVVHRHRFNGNKSSILWVFSRINQAWMVWRQDGLLQGNVRIHNQFEDAQEDFSRRIKFIREMGV